MLPFFLLVFLLTKSADSEALSRERRSWIIDSFTITEEHPGPFPYVLGTINIDSKHRVDFDLHGQGVDQEPKGVISIDKVTGIVYVHKAVDYEKWPIFKLKFEARKTDLSIDTRFGVEITILDINDNPPRFLRNPYKLDLEEEKTQGSHLLTVQAEDKDKRGTLNSTFDYDIKSVSPDLRDTEFFIEKSGAISFKGCLDHEVADKITILVEARDHGEAVSLSSSTTVLIYVQDGNNHLPSISGQTGSGKVREHETGSSPLRLHVTDKDSKPSPAWRAKYTIHGDKAGHFRIDTDPESNDGILTAVKPLDFEEGAQVELSISVENELPYFLCTVREKTPTRLWKTDTIRGKGQSDSTKVIIQVEDVNEPPVFSSGVKEVTVQENTAIGTWLEKVTAVDHDSSHSQEFVYEVGNDPAGWLTVDPQTGDITLLKSPDRESPHVVNSVYSTTLQAVDKGEPPMTGTTTLHMHIIDLNDNQPQPVSNNSDVCLSEGPTTNITAFDLDENPFGGPFTFELLGDVAGKWKLSPSHGYSAGLVKGPAVYAGSHTVRLKISDMQGQFGVHNLSVTVCDCSVIANCRAQRIFTTEASSGAVGLVFAALFLLLLLLLIAVAFSCKKKFIVLEPHYSEQTLLKTNTETPGTDCKDFDRFLSSMMHKDPSHWPTKNNGMQQTTVGAKGIYKDMSQSVMGQHMRNADCRKENQSSLLTENYSQVTRSYFTSNNHSHTSQNMGTTNFLSQRNFSNGMNETISTMLHQKLATLWERENYLTDYPPHRYADEGEFYHLSEMETITNPDDEDSFQRTLIDLDSKFNQLASICKPPEIPN